MTEFLCTWINESIRLPARIGEQASLSRFVSSVFTPPLCVFITAFPCLHSTSACLHHRVPLSSLHLCVSSSPRSFVFTPPLLISTHHRLHSATASPHISPSSFRHCSSPHITVLLITALTPSCILSSCVSVHHRASQFFVRIEPSGLDQLCSNGFLIAELLAAHGLQVPSRQPRIPPALTHALVDSKIWLPFRAPLPAMPRSATFLSSSPLSANSTSPSPTKPPRTSCVQPPARLLASSTTSTPV
jgi:hypothetical protein